MRSFKKGRIVALCLAIIMAASVVMAIMPTVVQAEPQVQVKVLTPSISPATNRISFGGVRYIQFFDAGLTWDQARAHAVSLGGDLLTIRSTIEFHAFNSILRTHGTQAYYWIGGYRIADTGPNQFAWASGEPMHFTGWGYGEPNNMDGIEDRIAHHRDGHWNDLPNNPGSWHLERLGFVVEFPLTSMPTVLPIPEWGPHTGLFAHTILYWGNVPGSTSASFGVDFREQRVYYSTNTWQADDQRQANILGALELLISMDIQTLEPFQVVVYSHAQGHVSSSVTMPMVWTPPLQNSRLYGTILHWDANEAAIRYSVWLETDSASPTYSDRIITESTYVDLRDFTPWLNRHNIRERDTVTLIIHIYSSAGYIGNRLNVIELRLPNLTTPQPYTPNLRIVAEGTHNGRRFALIDGGLTWEQARAHAQYLGGDLAVVRNQATQDFILDDLLSQGSRRTYWVGGYRIAPTGTRQFAWVSGDAMTFTNWAPGQPNNISVSGDENHIVLYGRHGEWNNFPNYPGYWHIPRMGFIVEFPVPITTLPETIPDPQPDPQPPVQPQPPTVPPIVQPRPPGVDIAVNIEGSFVHFEDQQPVIVDGRTLVPVRGVFEKLGFVATWNDVARQATLTSPRYTIVLTVDSNRFTTNGVSHTLDVPAQIINGRTMIPLRAVLETVGYDLTWDDATRTVYIICLVAESGRFLAGALMGRDVREFEIITGNRRALVTSGESQHNASRITLPNRRLTEAERQIWIYEYRANGGATAFEIEVVRLINEIRSEHNLNYLPIDNTLMIAARFYSQTMANLNTGLGHDRGPYGGSRGTLDAFEFGGAVAMNGAAGGGTPAGVVSMWMNSPGHRNNILSTNATRIGVGSYGAFTYAMFEWWGV